MAGRWDVPKGRENNFSFFPEARAAGHYICENSPVPLVFLGFEAGCSVITGNTLPEDDMVKVGLAADDFPDGRCSWDPMLVIAAVMRNLAVAGYSAVTGTAHVNAATGESCFTPGKGSHAYLVKTQPDSFYADMINGILE